MRALRDAADQADRTGAQRVDGEWRHMGYLVELRGPFVGKEERN